MSRGGRIPKRWIWSIGIAVAFAISLASRRSAAGSRGDFLWALDLAAALGAGWGIRWGFRQLREKNMIENIPPSPIRSVAMGLTAINGQAIQEGALLGPLSRTPCVYYRFLVEEERSGRRGKEWVTVDQGASDTPFHVQDPTGRILIVPLGGEVMLGRDYRVIDRQTGLLSPRRRNTEWRIHPSDAVYVIGTVSKMHDMVSEERQELLRRLQETKKDPEAMKRFDRDGDGTVSSQEWDGAVAVVKDELLREHAGRPAADPLDDLYVGQGTVEDTFLIADRDPRSVASALGWRALGAVAAGGTGCLVMAGSLLGRFGMTHSRWTFPWGSIFR